MDKKPLTDEEKERYLAILKTACVPERKWEHCLERAGRLCPGCNLELNVLCPDVEVCLTCQGYV